MTVSVNTLIDRSVRNMGSGINSVVKETAIEVIKRAYDEGIRVQISSGYRSNAEQTRLYNQGRTTPGNKVTNAKAGQSYHNFGLAVDYFLVSKDGKTTQWTVNADWRRVAAIGKSLGFEWGGDWSSFKDYPHLQMTGGLSLAQLRAGKRPSLNSKVDNSTPAPSQPSTSNWTDKSGNWSGGTLKQGHKGDQVKQLQELLAANHFYPNKGAKNNGVDGYYGLNTEDAVRRYQSMNGLSVDGIAGKKTYASLKGSKSSGSKPKPSGSLPNTTYQAKKPYPSGDGVRAIQEALAAVYFYPDKGAKNNGIDGVYGPKTADAVKRYQSMHGLKADGIYGPKTRAALLK